MSNRTLIERDKPPVAPRRPINYDLLYQYVAGRYPRILRRLAEKD